jgi:hypothetical protein
LGRGTGGEVGIDPPDGAVTVTVALTGLAPEAATVIVLSRGVGAAESIVPVKPAVPVTVVSQTNEPATGSGIASAGDGSRAATAVAAATRTSPRARRRIRRPPPEASRRR